MIRKRQGRSSAAWAAAATMILGCGSSSEVSFGVPAPDTTGGSGGSGGNASASATGTGTAGGQTSSSSATSSASSSIASSTAAGGGSNCVHPYCEQGTALTPGCDDCVAKVCAADPFCCETAWDAVCVHQVALECNVACPGDPNTPGCAALYGSTPGFQLCSESATTCSFAINTQQGSCGARCAASGGECIAMINDDNNVKCVKSNETLNPESCGATNYQSAICICSRGCGGGLPCSGGNTCKGGVCD